MAVTSRRLGAALYGLAFAAGVPAILAIWSLRLDPLVAVPLPAGRGVGIAILAAASVLAAFSVAALRRHGGGWPMNAFPPERFVRRGAYRFLDHPIYVAFCAALAGAALAFRSPAGLWVAVPAAALGCAALVLGFEAEYADRLFGTERPKALVRLPPADDAPPRPWDVASVFLLVLVPWLLVYEVLAWIGPPADSVSTFLDVERRWPVWPWTEIFYGSVYPVVVAAPFFARTRRDLRGFALAGLGAMALVFPLFLVLPLQAPPRPFAPRGVFGELLALERRLDTPGEAFPSFHVVWAWIACGLLGRRSRAAGIGWRTWATAVTASCVTTGMHSLTDVAAGLVVVLVVLRAETVRDALRRWTESIANSWREWRFGRVRVINHGAWGGIGTFVGLVLIFALTGPGSGAAILLTAFAGLAGAGAWAQWIEGSPQLMRPYGFFGGVFGVMLATLAAPWLGTDTWLVLAGFAVAAPWIQSFGRLRCLVQGCCHGRPAPDAIGIRYRHPRSRVVRLGGLAGVPIHPTPLYSILWNVVVAGATLRFWLARAPLHQIAALYLILTGLGRFVEESYRGEPQTPVVAGLRLYQWVAAGIVLLGIAISAFGRSAAAPVPGVPGAGPVAAAAAFGLLVAAALGVDFPESNRRFSRLA